MIYWHLQMYKPWGEHGDTIDSTKMLTYIPPVIGTGDWDNIQCRYFTGEDHRGIVVDDIVLVREGSKVIALCKVLSDSFTDLTLEGLFHHSYYRKVKLLYLDEDTGSFPLTRGTLARLTDPKTDSWKFINQLYQKAIKSMAMDEYLNLLKSKGQIILQGPPGTGKTKHAKDIAKDIASINVKDTVTDADIISRLTPGLDIATPTGYNTFKIVRHSKGAVVVYPKDAKNEYSIAYSDIIKSSKLYKHPNQNQESEVGGKRSYLVSIANFIVESLIDSQIKLIQFHPAYTYEDFVRGITVKNVGSNIEYKTENKVLANIARDAQKTL